MIVREISDDERGRFNSFVASFPTGDLMQSYEWGEVKARSGWKPVRVICEKDGVIAATASVLIRQIPHTRRSIAYVPRGPVVDTGEKDLFDELVSGMRRIALSYGAILIKIDPPIPIEDEVGKTVIEKAGFRAVPDPTGFGGTQPKCVMQLDLDGSEEEIFARFKPKWRYNIRLAERHGVRVKSECTKDDLKVFYELLKITAERDRFLVRSFSYFETLWDILTPPGYAKLFLAYYNDTPLAGALDFVFGDRAWYVYGASSNEHRNLMPNHLLQWEMIRWAKSLGCKWYDFRGVSPRRNADESEDHLQGLNRFKSGFSPRYVEYLGEYDFPLSPVWYWFWVHAKPTVSNIIKRRARQRLLSDV